MPATKCAILLVTHDNRILDIADRILTLEDGHIKTFAAGLAANTGHLLKAFAQMQRNGDLAKNVSEMSDRNSMRCAGDDCRVRAISWRPWSWETGDAVEALIDQILDAVTSKMKLIIGADRASIFVVDT